MFNWNSRKKTEKMAEVTKKMNENLPELTEDITLQIQKDPKMPGRLKQTNKNKKKPHT